MDKQLQKKSKTALKNCGIWKDFYSTFSRLPTPFQHQAILQIESLITEIKRNPEAVLSYDRDIASASKYFPATSEILESGKLLPFRTIIITDELNKDLATVNFVSCYLVRKLKLELIICKNFCNFEKRETNCLNKKFTDRRIIFVSCSYRSFDDFD